MAKFGSARSDERGQYRGGQRGDQTTREVMVQEAYMHRNGWTIIRAKDPNVANALAWSMSVACAVDTVGYNQDDRYAIFWTSVRDNVPTNCDCSTLVAWCVCNVGINNFDLNDFYTGNEVERLVGTGAFDVIPCHSIDDMYTGDILVDARGTSHTGIIVEGKSRTAQNTFDLAQPVLKKGSTGAEVKKWQIFLNFFCGGQLALDSVYGEQTKNTTKDFQKFFGLSRDGVYGGQTEATAKAVIEHYNVIPV